MISSVDAFKQKKNATSILKAAAPRFGRTSKTSRQSWRHNKRRVRNLTVRATQSRLTIVSEFDKHFLEFALLEPDATFMCYPFREDVEGDSLTSKIATLFHQNSSGVEDEILTRTS